MFRVKLDLALLSTLHSRSRSNAKHIPHACALSRIVEPMRDVIAL